MIREPFNIDICIENEYSKAQFFKYLYDYASSERELLKKIKIQDIILKSGCSYYQIQKFKEEKPISLKAYFKLVKYARSMFNETK